MITQLKGRLVEKNPTDVVIDCNGIGYQVHISLHTYSKINSQEQIVLFTHLLIKEDSHTLYGFVDKAEREIFRLLISVSGVGASTARTMLSSLNPIEIRDAIATDDASTIQSVKGIGAKTAQRVILDLKDKILKIHDIDEVFVSSNSSNKDEALTALEVLGFSRKLAEKVVDKIVKEKTDLSVEEIIKDALRNL